MICPPEKYQIQRSTHLAGSHNSSRFGSGVVGLDLGSRVSFDDDDVLVIAHMPASKPCRDGHVASPTHVDFQHYEASRRNPENL
jgi:hypothetical protein